MPKRNKHVEKTKGGLKFPHGSKQFLTFDEDGNELWEIENIVDDRIEDGQREYLVKWRGWPYKFCTWEPEESFLEDMDTIIEFVKKLNENRRRVYRPIEKQEEPRKPKRLPKSEKAQPAQTPSRYDMNLRSKGSSNLETPQKSKAKGRPAKNPMKNIPERKYESSPDVEEMKVVLQKITLPEPGKIIKMQGNDTVLFWADNNGENDENQLTSSTKATEFFICANNEDNTTQINTDENETHSKDNRNKGGFFWNPVHEDQSQKLQDSDDDSFNDYDSRREEMETDKMAEMLACPSQLKTLQRDLSAPLMENELEKISDYKIVIEECFAYARGQPGSFRFKVAFYDSESNLKGYDYYTYDEIKEKNWATSLLDFFTQEILTEIAKKGRSLTKNIKVI